MKVNEPFIRKVDMVDQPPHYQFDKFNAHAIIEAVGKTYKSASVLSRRECTQILNESA